jgi:hypothetical protein
MQLTDYHAKYYAYELTKRCSSDTLALSQGERGGNTVRGEKKNPGQQALDL